MASVLQYAHWDVSISDTMVVQEMHNLVQACCCERLLQHTCRLDRDDPSSTKAAVLASATMH